MCKVVRINKVSDDFACIIDAHRECALTGSRASRRAVKRQDGAIFFFLRIRGRRYLRPPRLPLSLRLA
jgi:hypothetical protein